MTIEIEELQIDKFYDALRAITGVENFEYLNSTSETEITIFLNITFTTGTGNLLIDVRSVPG